MTTTTDLAAVAVVAGYNFGLYRTIVDVGGGQGGLLAAILAATPKARGVLYDRPKSSRRRPRCCGSRESKTGSASRVGRSLTAFRPPAPPISSKT